MTNTERERGVGGAQPGATVVEQEDVAQKSKHTAGSLRAETSDGGGSPWPPVPLPSSLPVDSCTQTMYLSPPHLAGGCFPLPEQGALLTPRHQAEHSPPGEQPSAAAPDSASGV